MEGEGLTGLAVLKTRLDVQDKALAELRHAQEVSSANHRADAKEILAEIVKTNLTVAGLPKWDDIKAFQKEVEARIGSLETTRAQQTGGWKVLATIGTVCAAVGGWIGSLFGR